MKAEIPQRLLDPVTAEEIEEARKTAQAFYAARESRLSPAAARMARAVKDEKRLLDLIDFCEWQILAGDTSEDWPLIMQRHLYDLSVALRNQGRIREAIEVAPDHEGHRKGLEALERADDEFCDCQDSIVDIQGRRKILPRYRLVDEIYHPTKRAIVFLWQCQLCKFMNATPQMAPGMARFMSFRNRPKGARPVPDIEVLEDAPAEKD